MPASATATASCSSSLPLELVPIFLAVAVTVAEAVEKLDFKLFSAVQKTLEGVSSAGLRTVLQWLLPLAVRVQLTLRAANDPVAELLGRTIDAKLEGRANGVPIRHWATHPLVGSCGIQVEAAAGQQSKGVTRVRASGMLIPTAGLLHLRQASMDVAVSISRAHAAAAPARRACADRVHVVR